MIYTTRELISKEEHKLHKEFIDKSKLDYEITDITIGLFNTNILIGSISLKDNIIKLVNINEDYKNQGLLNTLITCIIKKAYKQSIMELYVYTKLENEKLFNKLGFNTIVKTNKIAFLENNNNFKNYLNSIKNNNPSVALVMNLNPITKGHIHLIEKAYEENELVHLFLVKEDVSFFSHKERLNLLKEETKHLQNIIIHEGNDYIISNKTFPSYFLKDKVNEEHAYLDIKIFNEIIKHLNIKKRYIGSEPNCKVTNNYNKLLKNNLDCEVVEIKRITYNNEVISASRVRELMNKNNYEELKNLVNLYTYKMIINRKKLS